MNMDIYSATPPVAKKRRKYSKELTLLQNSRIRRQEIRRLTQQVLEQDEVSIGQVSSREDKALP